MPYGHLNDQEREVISQMRFAKYSAAAIARKLGRHRGTICRELKRNGDYSPHSGRRYYSAIAAGARYRLRRRDCRKDLPLKLQRNCCLLRYVKEKLGKRWSPEQIAGRLPLDFGRSRQMRISHQSIYVWIARDKQHGGSYFKCLRQSRKPRRKRYGSQLHKFQIRDRVSIKDRPNVVNKRRRLGDWEGDTMQGKDRRGFLLTQVERKSGYVLINKLSRCTAPEVNRAAVASMQRIPARYRRTMTFDNGSEFSGHQRIQRRTGLKVYFAHPYCSWERGTNENTNGLIREFFPKNQPLTHVTHQRVARVAWMLNNRPRKRLGYRTPAEVLRIAT